MQIFIFLPSEEKTVKEIRILEEMFLIDNKKEERTKLFVFLIKYWSVKTKSYKTV